MLTSRYPEPLTCRLLRSLQPGETMTYYKGTWPDQGNTSEYAELLRRVRDTASRLQSEGRVALKDETVFIDAGHVKVTCHIAIGL